MRKVIFIIDDLEFFKQCYGLTSEGLENIFSDKESFKAIYTLYGDGKNVQRYKLTDHDGNKMYLDCLNGYQKGVVLNDCMAYFTGGNYHSSADVPCGVIDIKEEEIKENDNLSE